MNAVSATDFELLMRIQKEEESRKREALRLYEPTTIQARFHESLARERIFMAGNQVGKSLAVFTELARAMTGQDPLKRYPERDGVAMVVTWDETTIGTNVYRYLLGRGVFDLIRDKVTGEWRSYRPWDADDRARKHEVKPSPPLIPRRLIKGKPSFSKAGKKVLSRLELVNGWVCHVFSSRSAPAGGFQANIAVFDEDLFNADWYDEALARLTIRSGYLVWGALPLAQNDALTTCVANAEAEEGKEVPDSQVFRATVFDNPYQDEETRQANIRRWKRKGEDVYRKRALGELILDSWLMYPMFDKKFHSAICRDGESEIPSSTIQKLVTDRNGVPPPTWTRYAIIDPGYSVCAIAFFAVPPSGVGDYAVMYDTLYLTNCIPSVFGACFEKKVRGWEFEDFIIDMHGARHGKESGGKDLYTLYSEELKRRGIKCNRSGYAFSAGCDDTKSRADMLREWFSVRPDGTAKFSHVGPCCEKFEEEIRVFRKKRDPKTGHPSDEANRRGPCHLVECAEYAAAHGLPYVPPRVKTSEQTVVDRIMMGELDRRTEMQLRDKKPGRRAKVPRELQPLIKTFA